MAGDFTSRGSRAATLWRQARAGSGFVMFGAACVVVARIAGPLLKRRARSAEEGEIAVQWAVHRGLALTAACFRFARALTMDSRGLAGLEGIGPCVLVANHPTLIDIVLLGAHLPQMDCVVNAGWTMQSRFMAPAIALAGYVKNDAGQAAVDDCAARIRRGRKLLIFPEGTRSPKDGLGKFQRGAAHIALASGAPMVAVAIHCTPRVFGSGTLWHQVPDRTPHYELRIAGRLDPADYLSGGASLPIAARRMTEDLRKILLQELHLADA